MTPPRSLLPDAAPAFENPLVPNKRLRALYTAMVELRLLETRLSTLRRRGRSSAKVDTLAGAEGCLASTALLLNPGDLTSDAATRLATAFLRGEALADLVHRGSLSSRARRGGPEPLFRGELPAITDPEGRLHLAIGAAFALKLRRSGKSPLVAAYLHGGDLSPAQWTTMLAIAAQSVLPMLFVVLPGAQKTQGVAAPGHLALLAGTCGVPGIPVDAADPVALYRVAQESMLRARSGGGPVLMECIRFRLPGRKSPPADPIETLRRFLLSRKVADEGWMDTVAVRFAGRLEAVVSDGSQTP